MDTRFKKENEPSQGPSAIFWHAKDFATAHEVAASLAKEPLKIFYEYHLSIFLN
jgi:hypothetical protein